VAAAVVVVLLHFGGPNEKFLKEVRDARALADKPELVTQSLEKLSKLASDQGGDATKALEEVGGKVLQRANDLAKASDYSTAIALLQKAKPFLTGLGLHAETSLAEAEHAFVQKREAYNREAQEAYEALEPSLEKMPPPDQLKAVRDYRAKFPHQQYDDMARMKEDRLSGRQRQYDLVAEAEAKVAAGDPETARVRLADATALATSTTC